MKLKQIFSVTAACTLAAAAVAADATAPKRVLVFSKCEGFNHKASIAACKEKMAEEAKKGAFAVDFSDDYAALKIENLAQYDALVLNNTTCLKTKDNPHVAPAICSYVRWGGGLCVIHAGADNFYDAPECSHLVGGRFDGHPWFSNGTWAFKVEDRESPLTAPFKRFADGKFKRSDEIYQQSSPFYDRSKLHVLISLDLSDPVTAGRKGQKRADKDYAVSWIRRVEGGGYARAHLRRPRLHARHAQGGRHAGRREVLQGAEMLQGEDVLRVLRAVARSVRSGRDGQALHRR